jgi:hypothetical protein
MAGQVLSCWNVLQLGNALLFQDLIHIARQFEHA